jgi:putative tricarboxylic transport membrane protein
MKRPYQIAAVVLLLFSAFIIRESLNLDYLTALGPGGGFFPFWLGILLLLLSLIQLYQATFTSSPPMPKDFWATKTGYLKTLAVLVAMAWAVKFLDVLGFRLVMVVFFLWLLLTLGKLQGTRGWVTIVAITAVGSWGAAWLFGDMLQVPLPSGPFGF